MTSRIRIIFVVIFAALLSIFEVDAQQTLPYFDSFEDADVTSRWTFVQPTSRHKWCVGNATASMGSSSLYVSADGGVTPGYTNSAKGIAAYTTITLPAGMYNVSFDFRVVGECDSKGVGLDSLYVYWVTDPNERIIETNGERPTSLEVYRQPIVHNDIATGPNFWHNNKFTARVRGNGTAVRLVFYWVNNSANIVPPGACIDNVQITTDNDPCPVPANFSVSHRFGANLSWDATSASHYQVYYKNTSTGEQGMIDSVATNPYVMGSLDKGVYTFWLRGICGADTSGWTIYANHIIAVSTDKCINFIDIHNPDIVECRYGRRFETAKTNLGPHDEGYASENSQHTVHFIQGERDPKVPELTTIAPGEFASVRLGNWRGKSEAECMTYKLTVDAANPILVIKYAAVLENIGHTGEDFAQPRFIIRVTDNRGVVLDKQCLNIEYLTGSPTFPPGWNRISIGWGEVAGEQREFFIEWKDWTTMGINLSAYIGRTVNIYIETGDCTPTPGESCYGYAYFSMDCVSDKLSGLTCGASAEKLDTVWAPKGFRYEWVKKTDPTRVLYTDQYLVPQAGDTATYICNMHFRDPGREACSFSLEAALSPRYPAAKFSHIPCRTTVNFIDSSTVFTVNGVTEEKPLLYWDFGDGETSDEYNPIHTYAEPGRYLVTLRASIDEGMCDSVWSDSVIVSSDTLKVEEIRYVCAGERTLFGNRYLRDPGIYVDTLFNRYGCDSISILDLRVHNTTADTVICGGDVFTFEGEEMTLEPGVHEFTYTTVKSVFGCDSMLRVEVSDDIVVIPLLPFCADADSAYFNVEGGLADSVTVNFNDSRFVPYTTSIADMAFAMPLPEQEGAAGRYAVDFTFYNEYCGSTQRSLSIDVSYPSSVIVQRWNDVLALQNQDNNGGYDFTSATFQWYADGAPVDGQSHSIYYSPNATLSIDALYTVEITTPDGVSIFTCPFQAVEVPLVDDDIDVSFSFSSPDSKSMVVESKTADVVLRVVDAVGRVVAIEVIQVGESTVSLPQAPGIYMLHLSYPDGRVTVRKIVIE